MNQGANHYSSDDALSNIPIEEAFKEAYENKLKLIATVVLINSQLVLKLKEKDDKILNLSNLIAELNKECEELKKTLRHKEESMKGHIRDLEGKLAAVQTSFEKMRMV